LQVFESASPTPRESAVVTDEKWPIARLIPISSASGIEAQERRLASALLAVMYPVPSFGHGLLRPLGAPAGRIETFIEVPFKVDSRTIRPDGVIRVTRAGKTWSALVEAKVASNRLDADQANEYLDPLGSRTPSPGCCRSRTSS
jgi:hypothetical protein